MVTAKQETYACSLKSDINIDTQEFKINKQLNAMNPVLN